MDKLKWSEIYMKWLNNEKKRDTPNLLAANNGAVAEGMVHLFERIEAIEEQLGEAPTKES